jgi:hypothetical protein
MAHGLRFDDKKLLAKNRHLKEAIVRLFPWSVCLPTRGLKPDVSRFAKYRCSDTPNNFTYYSNSSAAQRVDSSVLVQPRS